MPDDAPPVHLVGAELLVWRALTSKRGHLVTHAELAALVGSPDTGRKAVSQIRRKTGAPIMTDAGHGYIMGWPA